MYLRWCIYSLCFFAIMGSVSPLAWAKPITIQSQWYGKTEREITREKNRLYIALAALKSNGSKHFERAAYYFESMNKAHALETLLQILTTKPYTKTERVNSIYILGRMGPFSSRPVPYIIPYLTDTEPDVRTTAIRALERLGKKAKSALPNLRRIIKAETNKEIIRQLATAISAIEGKKNSYNKS